MGIFKWLGFIKTNNREELDINDFVNLHENEDIKTLEHMMVVLEDEELLHPDEIIKKYEQAIATYYELKKYCYSKGKNGRQYFSEMWQHCHNSTNPDFDFIDRLEERYKNYKDNYEKHLNDYNNTIDTLKRVSNPLEKETKRHYDPDAHYVNIDFRINIYANETNTYVSSAGQKCVDFEESLHEYVDVYNKSICPYCGKRIELPKQRKTCPHCKRKMFVVKGGIKQGMMLLKEEDKLKLYQLKEDFRIDKKYNPNYGQKIIVDDATNIIEGTKKEP